MKRVWFFVVTFLERFEDDDENVLSNCCKYIHVREGNKIIRGYLLCL